MAILDYETAPEDVVLSRSGWAQVGTNWQTVEPLRDRCTGLYARASYAGGKAALARLGLRMPYRAEVEARRLASPVALPVFYLPDRPIQQANAASRSQYPNDQAFVQSLLNRYMKTPEWAAYFDDQVGSLLRARQWNGRALITNMGKLWIAAGPNDTPVAPGRARLMGWWDGTRWMQQGIGVAPAGVDLNHDDGHHDYATLLYAVSETDPTGRGETTGPGGEAAGPSRQTSSELAAELPQLRQMLAQVFRGAGSGEAGGVADVGRVLLFGDSLAVGLTKPLGVLAKAAGVTFAGDGVQSSTIRDWLAGGGADAAGAAKVLRPRLVQDLAKRPRLTLVSLGTNDMRTADPAAEGRRAGALIAFLKENGAEQIRWIAPPSMPFDSASTEAFRTALDESCRVAGVPVFDSRATSFERDGIHFTSKGYQRWAAAIADWSKLTEPARVAAYKPAAKLTPAMHAWVREILHDAAQYPLGSKVDKVFGSRVLQARVATHLPDKKIPRPHRGVDVWEPSTEVTPAPVAAPAAGEAPALVALRGQLDRMWPRRKKSVDGIAASAAHTAKYAKGDHDNGNALDVTADKTNGPNLDVLAQVLLRDPRTQYVIWRSRIANTSPNPDWKPGEWRAYPTAYMLSIGSTKTDPHTDHLHVSLRADARENASSWDLSGMQPGPWQFAPQAPLAAARQEPVADRVAIHVAPFQAMRNKKPAGLPVSIGPMPMPVEDYIARVIEAEMPLRPGAEEAAKAQAIAARTYLAYHMRKTGVGSSQKPVPNGEVFQVASPSASGPARAAAQATAGVMMTYMGRPILASYVAGTPWAKGASRAPAEARVTYNAGKTGPAVEQAFKSNDEDDRGGMSQNGALELAAQGMQWPEILRYFYGDDVEFTSAQKPAAVNKVAVQAPPANRFPPAVATAGSSDAGWLAGAAVLGALVYFK